MQIVKPILVTGLVISAVAAGVAAGLHLTPLDHHSEIAPPARIVARDPRPEYLVQHQNPSSFVGPNEFQPNVLELPKASSDFVGYWGGYIHSSIQRISPDLMGSSPERVSVIIGRRGDTVFMTSNLYTSPKQKIVRRPSVRIVTGTQATIEYEFADTALDYVCRDSFRLKRPSSIIYQGTIDVYDLKSHVAMGVVTENAVLRRLLTAREQLQFARPGRNQVPWGSVVAAEKLPN